MTAFQVPSLLVIFVLALSFLSVSGCQEEAPLFRDISSAESGITFNNKITENDSTNILDYEYVYNGGGIGVGDFNNDGLPDLYFTGNMVSNRLYINKGALRFIDVTEISGTAGNDKWYTGVTIVDINDDDWMDIYVSVSRSSDPQRRANELYINQGLNEDGIPTFKEEASAYGLADSSFSTHAVFFDYDKDGDLDMYLLVSDKWQLDSFKNPDSPNQDKLFRNDASPDSEHPVFSNVSSEAGITKPGYGLGVNVADLNRDGWKDIYVANDYASDDLLWINNGDGTFTDQAAVYFKHTSFSAMGTDIQDINNDGLSDVVTLDMLPRDNLRKKTMTNPNNYLNYSRKAFSRIHPQFTRNTLQLNRGPRFAYADSIGPPAFSEVGYLAGIAETDWSWAPLIADFDQDGYRDLLITNGTPKDKTDKDFVNFRDRLGNIASQSTLLDSIPAVKITNYLFKNNGDLTFNDISAAWGFEKQSFSNGAVWADFDNDGDLDIAINNINDEAFVYENTTVGQRSDNDSHWLQVELKGDKGIGSLIDIYYGKEGHQSYEYTPYRGYLSSVQNIAHFGLGEVSKLDSIVIRGSQGSRKVLSNVKVDQKISVSLSGIEKSTDASGYRNSQISPLFDDVTDERGIQFTHKENFADDFAIQRLLPHKLSEYGPALAVGDVDGNGTQDVIIGGSLQNKTQILKQQESGIFELPDNMLFSDDSAQMREDLGLLLFDADNDSDSDLYIVSGSVGNRRGSESYRDRFYENNGSGLFVYKPDAIPNFKESGSAVKAADYDKDGDLDLFVGGRVVPGFYPLAASSFILRNDSDSGEISFTNVTGEIAKPLKDIGLITDALWSDFDNDGWTDLILSGEWMPITFLKNVEGTFVNVTTETGLADKVGWWNSLVGGDFDNDGDVDYIAGNLGLNSEYRVNEGKPVGIYSNDFDNNGIFTGIPTTYIPNAEGELKEYPVHHRSDVMQMLRHRGPVFQTHEKYSRLTIKGILSEQDLVDAVIYKANYLQSSYVENKGDGKFGLSPLPVQAQFAPIFGMVTDDFNTDGYPDVLLNGNEYGAQVQIGSYDALNGLLLKGDGKGNFNAVSGVESGVYIPGNGKALVNLAGADGSYLVMASQNNGPLKLFESNNRKPFIKFESTDTFAVIHFDDGKRRRVEAYYGSSFLSASGRFFPVPSSVDSVEIVNSEGEKRVVK